jgi:hypothetical protein
MVASLKTRSVSGRNLRKVAIEAHIISYLSYSIHTVLYLSVISFFFLFEANGYLGRGGLHHHWNQLVCTDGAVDVFTYVTFVFALILINQ